MVYDTKNIYLFKMSNCSMKVSICSYSKSLSVVQSVNKSLKVHAKLA